MPIAYPTHVALLLVLCLLWSALFHHMQMFMHQNIWDWQLTDLSQKEEKKLPIWQCMDSKSASLKQLTSSTLSDTDAI